MKHTWDLAVHISVHALCGRQAFRRQTKAFDLLGLLPLLDVLSLLNLLALLPALLDLLNLLALLDLLALLALLHLLDLLDLLPLLDLLDLQALSQSRSDIMFHWGTPVHACTARDSNELSRKPQRARKSEARLQRGLS